MRHSIRICALFVALTCLGPKEGLCQELATVAEESLFARTSLYQDVVDLVEDAQARSDLVTLGELAVTAEGRSLPLVILSGHGIKTPQEARLQGRPVVLVIANIHAGEVDGKEAALMLIRDVALGRLDHIVENQVVLVVPIFNADGNDKLGDNRRDNGPELAGMRYNGQNLDLNRDYLKLDSPEVQALVEAFSLWEPMLFMDLHTTNGSYHREPVTYATASHPNTASELPAYMWDKLFPAIASAVKRSSGYDSVPYGNFADRRDPKVGWANDTVAARYGTNYAGLRSMFTILSESYAYAEFRDRVLGTYALLRSVLEYTDEHAQEMMDLTRQAALGTRETFWQEELSLEHRMEKLFDITLLGYELDIQKIPEDELDQYPYWWDGVLVEKTDVERNYNLPYLAKPVTTRSLPLPEAYVVLPFFQDIIDKLQGHGIVVERLLRDIEVQAQEFQIEKVDVTDRIYQGRVRLEIEGGYQEQKLTLPEGSYLVSLHQPLARLIPVLLEPESEDSLVRWGFFNRAIVPLWNGPGASYPVLRLPSIPKGLGLELNPRR